LLFEEQKPFVENFPRSVENIEKYGLIKETTLVGTEKRKGVVMTGKEAMKNWEKEVMRRNLLASIICSGSTGGVKGSPNPIYNLWQRLFNNARM
jgi:hypothetical protein